MAMTKEQIADFLSKKSLEYLENADETINPYQKEISNGNIQVNRDPNNPLVIYKYDLKAHIEDFTNIVIAQYINEGSLSAISDNDIWTTFKTSYLNSPDNVSQFVEFNPSQSIIDNTLAREILDESITELVPDHPNRQTQIDGWFNELSNLLETPPNFTETYPDSGEYVTSSLWNDISSVPTSPSASITRIMQGANDYNYGRNQTVEQLRNRLDNYLLDVDSFGEQSRLDERPEYQNQSEGYLKFRGLNQSVIIRQEEGLQIDFANTDENGVPNYLNDGFTITKWIKFANKVNSGTLFNYGNPTRDDDPFGFRLETFVVQKDQVTEASFSEYINSYNSDAQSNGRPQLFTNTFYERFIKLVVVETDGTVRDSCPWRTGITSSNEWVTPDTTDPTDSRIYSYLHIPFDINEWYFIVANYNVGIDEDSSYNLTGQGGEIYNDEPDFWRWNIDPELDTYSPNSSYGAKCKVEVISKTDLLRARGYQS